MPSESKRKVLIFPSWYPDNTSPVSGIFIRDQAVVLAERYDVAVLVPGIVGWQAVLTNTGWMSRKEENDGLPVYRQRTLAVVPRFPNLSYRYYLNAARRGLERIISDWGIPDVIHAHVVLPGGWAAVKLGEQSSVPVILTEHSSPFSVHLQTEIKRRMVSETLARVHRIVSVSPALARQIQDFQNDVEVTVIGNVIRTLLFTLPTAVPESPLDSTRFVTIALLSEQKGIDYLLQAAQILIQRGRTDFRLSIGGDGSERPRLEQMALSLGLSEHIRFLGLLDRFQVRHWLQMSDVFILPSLHETFGIVLGEAMACGKPVIATRCGGPEFVVTPEAGLLVEPANASALADAMEQFMLKRVEYDPHLIRQSIVERFGEEAFLRNISDVYHQCWTK